MRIFFLYSACEWEVIKKESQIQGFENPKRFLQQRTRQVIKALPECPTKDSCERVTPSIGFCSTDGYNLEMLNKLENYCSFHGIAQVTLIRRLVTEPILAQRLLEGVSQPG